MRAEANKKTLLTPLEQRRLMYKKRKQSYGDRSEETFQKLQMFTEALRSKKKAVDEEQEHEEVEEEA